MTETKSDMIRLRCSKAALENMDPFIKTTFVEEESPINSGLWEQLWKWNEPKLLLALYQPG